MLSVKELKTLIKAHNKLSTIKIPAKATAEELVKLIESKNYIVDHEKKVIRPKQQRGKQITLKKAEELMPKKKEKTDADKKKDKDKKMKSVIKYITENKEILKHPDIKKLL